MKKNILLRVGSVWGGLSCLLSACMVAQPAAPVDNGGNNGEEMNFSQAPYQSGPMVRAPSPENVVTVASPSTYSENRTVSAYSNVSADTVSADTHGSYIPSTAAVDLNTSVHRVIYGDTVYNIAKRYHINQEDLRIWNHLEGDAIAIGQMLKVKGPSGSTANSTASAQSSTSVPVVHNSSSIQEKRVSTSVVTSPGVSQATTSLDTPKAPRAIGGITWIQPAQGRLVERFSSRSKGINIAGTLGAPIVAVADGKVIYSNTLDGYGNLVILQHSEQYLSAYANNQNNLVKEGDRVKRGQKIATMGKTDAPRVQLHFEVRQNGQAVDPLRFIPGY